MGLARGKKVRFAAAESILLSMSIALLGQNYALADDSSSSSSGSSDSSSSGSSSGSSLTPLFGGGSLFGDSSSGSSSSGGSDSSSSSSSGAGGGSSSSSSSAGSAAGGGGAGGTAAAGEGSGSAGGGSAGHAGGGDTVKVYDKEFTPVNPLQGLFQQQPQYPTPGTTQMFPEAVSPNMGRDSNVQGRNPGQASNIFQQEFKDPYAKPKEENPSNVNAIKGLFQQQPQYPTPGTTQMFPEALSKNSGNDSEVQGRNPGQASSTFQQNFKDPYAAPEAHSKDQTNYLQGLFQQQPQYVSPNKTIEFPNAVQKNLGEDTHQSGRHPGQDGTPFGATQSHSGTPTISPGLPVNPDNGPTTATAQGFRKGLEEKGLFDEKTEKLLDEKGLLEESKPKIMTKDEKEALDKKEKEEKEGTASTGGEKKEETAEKKDEKKDEKEGEKKEGDKKEEGDKKDETADKKDEKGADKKAEEKKDGDKKAEGEKKDGDKKDADKKASADDKKGDKKDEKKEEIKYAPYNPLREAISLMNSNKFQESIDLLNKEIKKTAINPQAFYTRAVVYVKMRKYPEASADYNEVLRLVPTGPMATLAKAGLSKLKF